jgi:hypothetical protein
MDEGLDVLQTILGNKSLDKPRQIEPINRIIGRFSSWDDDKDISSEEYYGEEYGIVEHFRMVG